MPMSSPETPTMSMRESLPPHARDWLWLPIRIVTLTLPTDDGSHTAFTAHWQPHRRLVSYNVAQFPGWRKENLYATAT